jgi:hypothetical protein
MKDHIIAPSEKTDCPSSFSEIYALHGILTECGVHRLWENPEMMLIENYLRHRLEDEHMQKALGIKVFNFFLRQLKRSEPFWYMTSQDKLLFWVLRFADGFDLKKALIKSLDSEPQREAISAEYDDSHVRFEEDHKQFNKLTTLMMIEGFPTHFGLLTADATIRLTLHESLVAKYGSAQVLHKLEKSIKTAERTQFQSMLQHNFTVKTVKAKTTCAQKYLDLGSIDRIRLMRYYNFVCSQNSITVS